MWLPVILYCRFVKYFFIIHYNRLILPDAKNKDIDIHPFGSRIV